MDRVAVTCPTPMESTTLTVNVPGNDLMSDLVGERDVLLRRGEGAFPGSAIHVRGNQITIDSVRSSMGSPC